MMPALLGTVPFDLMGLGADPIELFLLAHPVPTSGNVTDFLRTLPIEQRGVVAQQLLTRGVAAAAISSSLSWLEASARIKSYWPRIAGVLSLASAAVSAYHGYRRNKSIGWGVLWFFAGSIFPVVTPVFALAQGFGREKK